MNGAYMHSKQHKKQNGVLEVVEVTKTKRRKIWWTHAQVYSKMKGGFNCRRSGWKLNFDKPIAGKSVVEKYKTVNLVFYLFFYYLLYLNGII